MAIACPNTLRFARRVRVRCLLAGLVRHGGRGLAAGAVAGAGAVVASRLQWIAWPWWLGLAAACSAGLLVGLAAGTARMCSLTGAAARADLALGLKDRLTTALGLGRAGRAMTPAETLAVRDAEAISRDLRVGRVARVRLGASWAVWPLAFAGAVAAGLWLPDISPPARAAGQERADEPERRAAAEAIADASREVRAAAERTIPETARAEELARLEELERELLDGEREPEEALAEGARRLDRAAAEMERAAERQELAEQSLREQLAEGLETGEQDSDLARALSEGDLEEARRIAQELTQRAPALSEEERAARAEELRRLAEQLESLASKPPARDQALEQTLREQGVDPTEQGVEETDPEAIRQQLEREGLEREAAERLAQELAERNQQRAAEDQAREDVRELSDAAREAARELEQELPTTPAPTTPTPPQQPDAQPPPEQQDQPQQPRGQEGQQREGAERQGQEGQQREGAERQGQEGQQREGAERQGREGQQREGAEREGQEGQQREGAEREGREGQQREGAEREGQEGQQREGAERRGQEGQRREGAEQGREDRRGEGVEGQPEPGQPGGEQPQGVERLREQLERMAGRERGAGEQRQAAEKLRDQAQRLLEQATPEERRELERLARDMQERTAQREPRAPGLRPGAEEPWQSETFDARSEPGPDASGPQEVIADWLGGDGERPSGAAPRPGEGTPLREAAEGAERAIDRQAVPRARSDLVRRVFERFRRRAAEDAGASGDGG